MAIMMEPAKVYNFSATLCVARAISHGILILKSFLYFLLEIILKYCLVGYVCMCDQWRLKSD